MFQYCTRVLARLGDYALFSYKIICSKNTTKYTLKRVYNELYIIGVQSLLFIAAIAIFTGLILSLHGYYTLTRFNAQSLLGSTVALTLIQELAPVLTALMLIAHSGSATTSHFAMMRVTEQFSALLVHAIPPLSFIIKPRFFAFLIAIPILTIYFLFFSLISSYYFTAYILGLSKGIFLASIKENIPISYIYYSIAKSCIFAFLIASIASYIGYNIHLLIQEKGAYAIYKGTMMSVVYSTVAILIMNYILSTFFFI